VEKKRQEKMETEMETVSKQKLSNLLNLIAKEDRTDEVVEHYKQLQGEEVPLLFVWVKELFENVRNQIYEFINLIELPGDVSRLTSEAISSLLDRIQSNKWTKYDIDLAINIMTELHALAQKELTRTYERVVELAPGVTFGFLNERQKQFLMGEDIILPIKVLQYLQKTLQTKLQELTLLRNIQLLEIEIKRSEMKEELTPPERQSLVLIESHIYKDNEPVLEGLTKIRDSQLKTIQKHKELCDRSADLMLLDLCSVVQEVPRLETIQRGTKLVYVSSCKLRDDRHFPSDIWAPYTAPDALYTIYPFRYYYHTKKAIPNVAIFNSNEIAIEKIRKWVVDWTKAQGRDIYGFLCQVFGWNGIRAGNLTILCNNGSRWLTFERKVYLDPLKAEVDVPEGGPVCEPGAQESETKENAAEYRERARQYEDGKLKPYLFDNYVSKEDANVETLDEEEEEKREELENETIGARVVRRRYVLATKIQKA
jgi:hypothetical protein